jgi:hypothetical protein
MLTGLLVLAAYALGAANVLIVQYFTRLEDERPDLRGFGGQHNDKY